MVLCISNFCLKVNYYKGILQHLREKIREKRENLWSDNLWLIYHNMRLHTQSCQFAWFVLKIRLLFSPKLSTPQTCLPAMFLTFKVEIGAKRTLFWHHWWHKKVHSLKELQHIRKMLSSPALRCFAVLLYEVRPLGKVCEEGRRVVWRKQGINCKLNNKN